MLDTFVRGLIKGIYASQSNGKHFELVSEHGDLIKLILTGNIFVDQPERNNYTRCEDISSERSDLVPVIVELDTFNLLTIFGEPDCLALSDNDPDVFKLSDFLNKNGEIYEDTLSSTPDHEMS